MQERSRGAKIERGVRADGARMSGALGGKERMSDVGAQQRFTADKKAGAIRSAEAMTVTPPKSAARADYAGRGAVVMPRRVDEAVANPRGADERPVLDLDRNTTVANPALHTQVEVAESLRRSAERDDVRYADRATALGHREMLGELVQSARRVEETAPTLSQRDRALARYLIAAANVEAADVQRQASQLTALRDDNLASLRQATGQVRAAQLRIDAGKPPLDYRPVRILVLNGAGNAQVSGLRVYALPKDMVERPERYPPELLRELLHDLTLENLTSPSQGLVPLSDLRIWVGPEYAYDQMQKLVLDKKLVQYKPVHAQATTVTLDLVFRAPDDVPQLSAAQ